MTEKEWIENYREFFEGLDDDYIGWLTKVVEGMREEEI